ncbi:hypothetical protein [Streptomyces sp. SBT349]|uniref:hypothetical protein n=1 Tax=Streptomyces sp. SBT349 TaxID=1580539 RepID=UPI00069DE1D8|nr:hypothetical protein [Streptomyces sp. SBT349]
MGADPVRGAVRRQLSLGRLVPLGRPVNGAGAWLAERAAEPVLRRAAESVPGVRVEEIRLSRADPGTDTDTDTDGDPGPEAAVPPPPSGLPPGPLRITARFATGARRPLPAYAEDVRAALAAAAAGRLGLEVAAVDCEVTGLDTEPARPSPPGAADRAREPVAARVPPAGPATEVAAAVLAVPGVRDLAGDLGGPSQAVVLSGDGRRIRVQLTTDATHRTRDVALAAGAAAARAARDPALVTVVVTDIVGP